MCWRCDKVKQSNYKCLWNTSKGLKHICHGCYTQMAEREEIAAMRVANQKAGLIPKGFGLGCNVANAQYGSIPSACCNLVE